MNQNDVKRLALVLSIQAEIEGMKAHNKICEINGNAEIMHNQSSFNQKGEELSNLAFAHDDQLFY